MTEQKKEYQHTIAKEVSYSGIGLHSGKDVLMTLKPAEADTGIVFGQTGNKGFAGKCKLHGKGNNT